MSKKTELEAALARIQRLENAIAYALSGMDLAYISCSKGFIDETLLHIGHHSARLQNVHDGLPPNEFEQAAAPNYGSIQGK